MKTEKKIIKLLIETKKEMIIRELAKGVKADYKIVHTAIQRLISNGIVEGKKIGKSIQIKFANKISKEVFEVEFERREKILANKNIEIVLETIKENLGTVNFILILFGSHAKNKAGKKSDIDLMFIVYDKKLENKIEQALSILPLKIHSFVFTEKQFRDMKDSRELNVVKEAVQSNVILHGIEQYYDLLNWEK